MAEGGVLRVTHIITGLGTGGAEMMLFKLLSVTDRLRFASSVLALNDGGPMAERIAGLGVRVQLLNLNPQRPSPLKLARLVRWLRADRPDVVQTWMYHADLLGGLAGWWVGAPVIWGIRHTDLSAGRNKRRTIQIARLCARLSPWLPRRIVVNSQVSALAHQQLGYAPEKMVVIPNGFELERFRPDGAARTALRAELGLAEDTPLVGLAARFDPQKDHRTFVAAAEQLHRARPDVHFVLCGEGVVWQNAELAAWIEAGGLRPAMHLLGRREDMPRLMAAWDVAASSSRGEAFANVIGEAMACGVPCVVTDVGDSAAIVGACGRVVPPGDAPALAGGLADVLAMAPEQRSALGLAARQRVAAHFRLPAVVARYEDLYRRTAERQGA